MPKFIFAYHGGKKPESPEDGEKTMAAWNAWFEEMGDAVLDIGNPAGPSKTVTGQGIEDNGGANPLSGYSLIQAENTDAATKLAQGCPILEHGSIEVAEAMEM